MAATTIECPQCHFKNSDDAEFCEQCGAELPAPVASANVATQVASYSGAIAAAQPQEDALVCPKCKAPYVPGDIFCFNCGNDLRNLPGNTVAAASGANGTSAAAPTANSTPVATATPAAAANGMSEDDWDKAFENPATAAATPAPTPTPVAAATPAPTADPVQNGSSANNSNNNAFSAPTVVATPVSTPTATAGTTQLTLNVSGPYGQQIVEFQGRELLLGRTDAKTRVFPDVNLDDSAASRRHVSVWLESGEGQFYVQDLESANGTSLNGNDIDPGVPIKLNNGDILKIGTRYSIQIHIS
jgi:hypothetical protein